MVGIFDSHAHYDNPKFSEDCDETLKMVFENGVSAIINIGSDMENSHSSVELANKYQFIYSSVGVHPHSASEFCDDDLIVLEKLTKNEKVVAIGEIGLDYHYDFSPREIQKKVFISQLDLAKKLNKPIIVHSREATSDTLEVLKNYDLKGVVHCFSGSAETAKIYLDMGYYIGFTGVVTFDNAQKAQQAVESIPLERLLLETDCPYMAPVPFRGKRATSDMIKYIAQKIAEIKNVSPQYVIDITRKNTCDLFNIDPTLFR